MSDTVKMSIEESFTQMEQHVSLCGFLYDLTRLSDKEELLKLCQGLDHALRHLESADIDGTDLCEELIYLCSLLPTRCSASKTSSMATAERSFSKLKLIKTYLRSTMADDRLSLLAILSIENRIASNLDMPQAVAQFATLKARKVAF
ncbi:unnamed protein product [Ixodes pacificus]